MINVRIKKGNISRTLVGEQLGSEVTDNGFVEELRGNVGVGEGTLDRCVHIVLKIRILLLSKVGVLLINK